MAEREALVADTTSVDVVLLTALVEERDAVLACLPNAQPAKRRNAYRGKVGPYNVILMCMNGMGNVNAAAVTQQAIGIWNPAYVLLCGITGGIREPNTRMLGDVLVAEQVVAYEPGKQRESELERRYEVFRPAKALLEAARRLDPARWVLAIRQPRPDGTTGRVIPKVHLGVLGSGEKVVTDPDLSEELQSDWARLIGLEMEGVGTALATYIADTRPGFLIVKGISDWADPEKEDSWRAYAAEASAAFTRALLRDEPFEPGDRPQAVRVSGPTPTYSGKVKIVVCRRLGESWRDLADYFDVEDYDRRTFGYGREPQGLWQWLSDRDKLGELDQGLEFIGRDDLLDELKPENGIVLPFRADRSGPPLAQ
jgi:nucleoside phosphorylase